VPIVLISIAPRRYCAHGGGLSVRRHAPVGIASGKRASSQRAQRSSDCIKPIPREALETSETSSIQQRCRHRCSARPRDKKVRERRHRLAPHARDGLAGATYAEAERERSWMRDDPWRRSPHTGFVGTPSRVDPPPERSTQMPIARMTALALASSPTRRAARSRHPSCPFRSYFEGDYPSGRWPRSARWPR